MMAVAVSTELDFSAGRPTVLFEGQYATGEWYRTYDVATDGRFLMIQTEEGQGPTQIHVVLNWLEELKRLVPSP